MVKAENIRFALLILIQTFAMVLISMIVLILTYDKFKSGSKCRTLSDNKAKIECWKQIIDANLAKGDLDGSMNQVAEFYQIDTVFAANCHDFTHTVGKKAYELFSKGVKFKVGDKTAYCAYGFYHGFMESLVSQNGDIETARDFCKFVDSEVAKTSPGAKLACYHGIGHGWTNVHDESLWGDEQKLIQPALTLCEKVTKDPEELKICATGVFDSISIGYYNYFYELKINKKDPYWICKIQKENYKTPCYMDISPAVLWLGEYRLDKALKFLPTVEEKFRDIVAVTLSEDAVRFILKDGLKIEDQIDICRSHKNPVLDLCIQGIASGYLQFGPPREEERLALNFCSNSYLNDEEKKVCFKRLAQSTKQLLSNDRYKESCSKIPENYRGYCN